MKEKKKHFKWNFGDYWPPKMPNIGQGRIKSLFIDPSAQQALAEALRMN